MRKAAPGRYPKPAGWRVCLLAICELFALYSLIRTIGSGTVSDLLVCLAVCLAAAVPDALERYGGIRMSGTLLVFSLFYLLASMAGRIYQLFYLTANWDKLLHLCGGVAFALVGSYLPVLLRREYRDDWKLRLLVGVLFSIAVAAVWEFYEFGMDHWLGTDMQRDTLVTAIHSYNLGPAAGVVGSIDPIESVVVNGVPLEGYLDLGLIDTMGDMLVETLGACIWAGITLADRGRHPALVRLERETTHE